MFAIQVASLAMVSSSRLSIDLYLHIIALQLIYTYT